MMEERKSLKASPASKDEVIVPSATTEEMSMSQMSISHSRRTSSILSDEDRQSFNITELADIINEAKHGWRRDGDCLTLEVTKMMSMETLMESKVTTWFHTRQHSEHDRPEMQMSPNLTRSQSDGHLHTASKLTGVLRHGRDKKEFMRSASHNPGGLTNRPSSLFDPGKSHFTSIPENMGEEGGNVTCDSDNESQGPVVQFQLGDTTGGKHAVGVGETQHITSDSFDNDFIESNNNNIYTVSYKKIGDSYFDQELDVLPNSSIKEGSVTDNNVIDVSGLALHSVSSVKSKQRKPPKLKKKSLSFATHDIENHFGSQKYNKSRNKAKKVKSFKEKERNIPDVQNEEDNDSDGFVDEDEWIDELDNDPLSNFHSLSNKKKKALVPKMESENVENIY